jgi:hypothetical protein
VAKMSKKWNLEDWFLYNDNEPAHLAQNKMIVISHHFYSPDLVLCDFFLCPLLKQVLTTLIHEKL